MDEHKLTGGEVLSGSMDVFLSYPPYNVHSGCERTSSYYDVLTLEGMTDVIQSHPPCPQESRHSNKS